MNQDGLTAIRHQAILGLRGTLLRFLPVLVLMLGFGCRRPAEAPQELDALSRFLFAIQADDDDRAIASAVDNLLDHLQPLDLTSSSPTDRTWELTPILLGDLDGIDRPDTRFGMELQTLGEVARDTGFRVFDDVLATDGGAIRGIVVPAAGAGSRKQFDTWTTWAQESGARGFTTKWLSRVEICSRHSLSK